MFVTGLTDKTKATACGRKRISCGLLGAGGVNGDDESRTSGRNQGDATHSVAEDLVDCTFDLEQPSCDGVEGTVWADGSLHVSPERDVDVTTAAVVSSGYVNSMRGRRYVRVYPMLTRQTFPPEQSHLLPR